MFLIIQKCCFKYLVHIRKIYIDKVLHNTIVNELLKMYQQKF